MIWYHPNKIRWDKLVASDLLSNYSNSNQLKLRSLITKIQQTKITYRTCPVNESFMSWFVGEYESHLQTKDNPRIHSVREATLNRAGVSYSALELFDNDIRIGATIYREIDKKLSIAYRVYKYDWLSIKHRCSPALYAEYLIDKVALSHNLSKISHGRDRNPFGINSSIGLAAFKLSVGCFPYRSVSAETVELDDSGIIKPTLLFLNPDLSDGVIKSAQLFASQDDLVKFEYITKYSNQVLVSISRTYY